MVVQQALYALVPPLLLFLSSCTAFEVSSPLQFNASVWGPASRSVVTVVDHLDLTVLDVTPTRMDDGSEVKMFFAVEPTVSLIRGRCRNGYSVETSLPTVTGGQCHMLVSWGHVFLFPRYTSVWIDRLYVREQEKPSNAATLISNGERQPSVVFRVLPGAELWVTRTTMVGTSASTAISVAARGSVRTTGKASVSNCTVTGFEHSNQWFGTVFSTGYLALENTLFRGNRVGSPFAGIVHAQGPREAGEVAIVSMQDVTLTGNIAVYDIIRQRSNARVMSDDPSHVLTSYNWETRETTTVPFDTLSAEQSNWLITTRSQAFQRKVEVHGWDDLTPPPSPGGDAGNRTTAERSPASRRRVAAITGSVVGVFVVLLVAAAAGGIYLLVRRRPKQTLRPDQELGTHGYPTAGAAGVAPQWGYARYQHVAGGPGDRIEQPASAASNGKRDFQAGYMHPLVPVPLGQPSSLCSRNGSLLQTDASLAAPLVAGGGEDWSSAQVRSIVSMSQYVGGTSTLRSQNGTDSQGVASVQGDEFATMPLPPPNPALRQGIEGIEDALDELERSNTLLMGKYQVVQGVMGRRVGGQGVVQFVRTSYPVADFAVKFFVIKEAFQSERDLYLQPNLRKMMPATREIVENADGQLRTPSGYVFPPCIVIERGQSLEDFAITLDRDADGAVTDLSKLTMLQAIIFAADCLRQLHATGIAHRDIKPSNILRLPDSHAWTLIDFGCCARVGDMKPITYSLFYAPPEVVAALESGCKTISVEKSMDAWALGIVAFEALTGTLALPRSSTIQDICNRITGRSIMPWEGEGGQKLCKKLGRLGRTILACLDRDPCKRPTSDVVVSSWHNIFSTMTATQASLASSSSS